MRLTEITLGLGLALLSGAQATAEQASASPALYASSADVAALIAEAKNERKTEPRIGETILRLDPYNVGLEYRPAVAPASVHLHQAELFYVIDGAATIVTGGKLVGAHQQNAENLAGTGVEGGATQQITKGDFVLVPEKTPHWFSAISQTLVVMSLHIPRPVDAPQLRGAPAGSSVQSKVYASGADVAALVAKARSIRKQGQANVPQSLLPLPPYSVNVEYRASVGNATVHVREAELFYVIDGAATLVTGGKLVNQTKAPADAENLAGDAIDGGKIQQIGKGDFIFVPENTPHWFSTIDQTLVVMSVHVPRPIPAAH